MPQLATHVQRVEICTVYQHIVYIAEQAHTLVCEDSLPYDAIEAYAFRYAVALDVHQNMRSFVASQASILVKEWLRKPRTAQ